jgi:ATP-binding cassette, subfamily B, bacterial
MSTELKNKIKIIKKVLQLGYRVNKRYFWISLSTSVLLSIAPIASGFTLSFILNTITGQQDSGIWFLAGLVTAYMALLAVGEAADEIQNVVTQYFFRYDMDVYLTIAIGEKVAELDTEFFENEKFAQLKSNVEDGFEWRIVDMFRDIMKLIGYGLSAILSLGALVALYPVQALMMSLAILPGVIVDFKMQGGLWNLWVSDVNTRRLYGTLRYITRDKNISRDLKLLNAAPFFLQELRSMMEKVFTGQKSVLWRRSAAIIASSLISYVVAGFLIVNMAHGVIKGMLLIGSFSFFVSNIFTLRSTFTQALFNLSSIITTSKYAALLLEFLDLQPKIVSLPGAIECTGSPKIEFINVGFTYPGYDKAVFEGLNLTIKSGEKVAIVGENGAGKSTLIKLLTRLYDVTEGVILIDGIDIKKYTVESLHKNFAVLLQDFSNFHGQTIERNIALGNNSRYDEELGCVGDIELSPVGILESISKSYADKFLDQKKIKSLYGRDFGGEDFSGGESQRIALARTFYKNAGLVIMDEPTSAVDAKAESEIFESLQEYLASKTVVFVSHRFSTVRTAERIIVVEQGKVIEEGSHKQLMALGGVYKNLFTLQRKGYEE